MTATVTDLAQYRQERERIIQEGLDTPTYLDDLREIETALEEELELLEWARQVLYPPLYSILGANDQQTPK